MHDFSRYIRLVFLLLLSLFAFGALAGDPTPQRPAIVDEPGSVDPAHIDGKTLHLRRELMPSVIAGMPYDLSSDVLKGGSEITLAARSKGKNLVSETIALPDSLPETVTVAFLANHEKELRQLRSLAKSRPGTLRFAVTAGERVLVDVPFAEADRGSVALTEGAAIVGSSRIVHANIKDPRGMASNGMQPDPECESACNDTYVECYYVICDQRGDCSYCWEDYEWCVGGCPQICVEPKQVYEYGTSWQYSGSTGEYICLQNWYRYILWTHWESRSVYERTVHCDNTYTDVFKRTETRYDGMCKQYHSNGCIGNFYNPPGNC